MYRNKIYIDWLAHVLSVVIILNNVNVMPKLKDDLNRINRDDLLFSKNNFPLMYDELPKMFNGVAEFAQKLTGIINREKHVIFTAADEIIINLLTSPKIQFY